MSSKSRRAIRPKKVIKKGGRAEAFDPRKIFRAVLGAFTDAGVEDESLCERLAKEITTEVCKKYGGKDVDSREIKKVVERVLVKHGYKRAANLYLLHRYM
ncbi:MAG: hypothetical protein HYS81_03630 [Candidatus Aenigmatarchaeota archaeon]|nr:MAG: hypothetical protein HYS81_03630 [Candidatus Aenigmarchaeota archaeon]